MAYSSSNIFAKEYFTKTYEIDGIKSYKLPEILPFSFITPNNTSIFNYKDVASKIQKARDNLLK
jgi:hypothetical protein